jgi:hypothetical protein
VSTVAAHGPFETVVLSDVLEHLRQPDLVLRSIPSLLAEGGELVVSLPHVGYAPLLASLQQEDFAYGSWGLLDRTHLRFFGIKNIQQLLEDAGFKIAQAELVRVAPEQSEFAAAWFRLDRQQRTQFKRSPFHDVYQVVVKAVPAAEWPGKSLQLVKLAPAGDELLTLQPAPGPAVPAGTGPRLIAFHLPQFHTFDENDHWWGKGFTEWTNVTKAKPLFLGHEQPLLPTELGFYDLGVSAAMRAQADLARSHGIAGFCYHYYWFNGQRLMEKPLFNLLQDPLQTMPFCLCWANENWTRNWDGAADQLLIEQRHPDGWVERFFEDLLPFLRDPRYLLQDGKPMLVVYRAQQIPEVQAVFEVWRGMARAADLPGLHICAALTHGNRSIAALGADSGVEFPPHNVQLFNLAEGMIFHGPFQGNVLDYVDVAEHFLANRYDSQPVFRCVSPRWDNTARRHERATLLVHGTPENYEQWLGRCIELSRAEQAGAETTVFVNAWNEWAEGCVLEPDRHHGRAFLEATLRAIRGHSPKREFRRQPLPGRWDWTVAAGRELRQRYRLLAGERVCAGVDRHPRLKALLGRAEAQLAAAVFAALQRRDHRKA